MRGLIRRPGAAAAIGTIAAAFALATSSCATYSDKTAEARDALQRGDYAGSAKEFNRYLKVRKNDQLPKKWKKNYPLAVLERATVLQAMREYSLSAKNFEVADKELELLDLARDGAGKLGKYIYSDSATKYKTSPTEKLALNAMNMCNYLARGDLDGAKIEAKRFTVMRKYLSDYDPKSEHGAFGSYLAGFVYERLGQANEALRYYEEALQERDFSSLRGPIVRLAKRGGSFRGERVKDYLPDDLRGSYAPAPKPTPKPAPKPAAKPAAPPPATPKPEPAPTPVPEAPPVQRPTSQPTPAQAMHASPGFGSADAALWAPPAGDPMSKVGEVLVVAKTGRVPFKEPRRIPIGAAIGLAGAFITGDTTILEYGMFKVVVYPELVSSRSLFQNADLSIDGQDVGMELATDLASEVVAEYGKIKPKIIGAALTRMIARAVAAEGARAAGRQAEGAGALVGFLAAAAVEGTLVALDKPDTRSWTTLPAQIYIGRAVVPPGAHELRLTVSGRGGRQRHTIPVDVPPGGFVVVDVTTLR